MVVRAGSTIPAWIAIALAACGDEPMPPAACASFPQQTVGVGEEVILEPCFSDPEAGTLTLAARSSDPEVATGEVLGDDVRIAGVSPGTAAVTVTATDPDMLTAEVAIDVLVPNRPPALVGSIPSFRLEAGAVLRLVLSEYFVDPDGQELAYDAVSLNPLVASVAVSADTLVITGVARGETTVTVTATDPGGLSATAPVNVRVRVNQPPVVVEAIPPELIGTDQTTFRMLSQHFRDPDGDELVYDATSSDPRIASVALSADTLIITGVAIGETTVTVTATDPGGLSATTEWDVSVADRHFRDDFESEASLDNWEVPEGTIAAIDNGKLVLTGAGGVQLAFVRRPWRAKDWTATARMANVTEDSWVQLSLWLTLDSRPAEAFLLQVGADPDDHWRTGDDSNWWLVAKRETSRGVRFEVVANGESAAVGDVGEMMDVTLSHVGPELSVTIADTVVFSTTDMGNGSQYSVDHLSLAVWAKLGATATGVFDRVEADGARPSVRQSTQHGSLPPHGAAARDEFGAIKWLRMGTRFRRLALEATHYRNRSKLSAKDH